MVFNSTKLFSQGLLVLVALSTSLSVSAEGDPEKGKAHFALCVACHGANAEGNKILNAPATAGQHATYLARQLRNFKQGVRGTDPSDVYGAQMRPMAMTLANDQAIEDVAAYIATFETPQQEATVVGDADAGMKLYSTCGVCHGENGEGVPVLNTPRLAGVNDWYLARQLLNFQNGVRGVHADDLFGTQMRAMSQLLLDETQINDVVAYIATLK